MSDYKFIGYLEEKKEDSEDYIYTTVIIKDNLYYYGSICNAGFMVESEGFETLEELYNHWYINEVLA